MHNSCHNNIDYNIGAAVAKTYILIANALMQIHSYTGENSK